MRVAREVGMRQEAQRFRRLEMRPGRIIKGRRMRRLRKVLRVMVPKRAPAAWRRLACTTCWLVGWGTARR